MLMKNTYGVECPGEVYSDPCHSQPVFQKYPEYVVNATGEDFKGTNKVCESHMCLPLYPGLTDGEVDYVVDSLKTVVANL
jgi:dTDP-4-amino-4,6-dideoxygalactose transaminase